jgi:predicted metalloenzyme YecM
MKMVGILLLIYTIDKITLQIHCYSIAEISRSNLLIKGVHISLEIKSSPMLLLLLIIIFHFPLKKM